MPGTTHALRRTAAMAMAALPKKGTVVMRSLPYPINFSTCSANNAMPRPEMPMRVSVIVHVRRV